MAGPADAKMSAKGKAQVRAKLRKAIKKNPRLISHRSFVKKAALVNFKLPVTLRLRGGNTPGTCPISGDGGVTFNTSSCNPTTGVVPGNSNPNKATVDLGASLGQREVDLGGKLAAEITFHDSFDGGALGNVSLDILPSTTKTLSSTSIPLLWNTQVTSGFFESNDLYNGTGVGAPAITTGCGNFTSNGSNTSPAATLPKIPYGNTFLSGANLLPPYGASNFGLPGYPVSDSYGGPATGFLPIEPGINDTQSTSTGPRAGTKPGDNDLIGGNPNPFPGGGPEVPGGFYVGSPTAKDTVLRTNALSLSVAQPSTVVNQSNGAGPNGSQNIVIGKSGGEANLFGNIPGKAYGIDVTVSLATRINSIIRVVDQDAYHIGVYNGQKWPAGLFNCQQVWTGGVDNYIPDVRLTGNLKIAPGLTSDGHLRIAKATVASQAGFPARFAVAACLFPHTTYAQRTTGAGAFNVVGPTAGGYFPGGYASASQLPVNGAAYEPMPTANCNSAPDNLVRDSALPPAQVTNLLAASGANGFTVNNDGSKVSVAADLNVQNVSIDVLIGDV
jgi:hypothetical protein